MKGKPYFEQSLYSPKPPLPPRYFAVRGTRLEHLSISLPLVYYDQQKSLFVTDSASIVLYHSPPSLNITTLFMAAAEVDNAR